MHVHKHTWEHLPRLRFVKMITARNIYVFTYIHIYIYTGTGCRNVHINDDNCFYYYEK